jgi:hypothetical protein
MLLVLYSSTRIAPSETYRVRVRVRVRVGVRVIGLGLGLDGCLETRHDRCV